MAKRIIECQVNDEYVLGSGVVVGAAGSHDDVVLRLEFGTMWAVLNKYATFRDSKGENPTTVAIMPSMLVDGKAMTYDVSVPASAKKYEGKMMLTLSGYSLVNGVEEDRATNTTTAYFRVLQSDFALLDDDTVDATLAQQVHTEINEFGEVLQEVEEKVERLSTATEGVISAEALRVTNETARKNAEAVRVSNENTRKTAEIARNETVGALDVAVDQLIATQEALLNGEVESVSIVAYPVGAVYLNTNAANPAALFGGTWENIGTLPAPVLVNMWRRIA